MPEQRHILHVDMDAFYASIEQRDNPELRGKPVVVGGGGNRGVVAAASYEARVFGVRSAMPMREARRRCPELLQVPIRMSHYQAISRQVFACFREFTPAIEGLSLDEAFLDVTASTTLFGDAATIAAAIKRRICEETRLNASVGVAPNKFVAKIASDLDKPDGLVVVTHDNLRATLDPLPVSVIPGIGRVTLGKVTAAGIDTISDLRRAPVAKLERIFGRFAHRMRDRAQGIDDRPVVASRQDKSISAEQTFDHDLSDANTLRGKLLSLSERTATRLRAKGLAAGVVQVKIRRADFKTFTRQRRLSPPSGSTDTLFGTAWALLETWREEHAGERIRLLGVGGSELSEAPQGDLFAADQTSPVDRTVDDIRRRFGSEALGRARNLKPDQIG